MTSIEQDLSQLLQEGFDALNRGQLDVAAKACQSALAQRPDNELGLSPRLIQKRRQ